MQLYLTYFIIGITVLFSIPAFANQELKAKMMFNAYLIKNGREWYRFFTHALIHADIMHLFMNMYVLYSFGVAVEYAYHDMFEEKARLFFLLLYIGGIFMSSIYSYEKHKDNIHYNALGASGAVSSVVFAFILMAPTARMGLIFIPFRFPAWIFGLLYLTYSWYMSKRGNDNIGHDAHFWGAVYGIGFTLCMKPALFHQFIEQVTGRTF
jgi:membrane associated rhomboid family serine protease